MSKLLPCPFCGKDDRSQVFYEDWNNLWVAHVECDFCEARGPRGDSHERAQDSELEAIAGWNGRASASEPAEGGTK